MGNSLQFVLDRIRKGKRADYPDYFITINQPEGFSATLSRERNKSVTIHYFDGGVLTFDSQQVDSFENLKLSDFDKLNLLKIAIVTNGFSGDLPLTVKNDIHQGTIHLGSFLSNFLELEVGNAEEKPSYQWFMDLLNTDKDQQFIRHHLATVRYFHGDFDPLKAFLNEDIPDDTPVDTPDESSFFEDS